MVEEYNTTCNSNAQCTAALVALNADASCVNALNNNDKETYCSRSCADLINAALNACPNVSDDIYVYVAIANNL